MSYKACPVCGNDYSYRIAFLKKLKDENAALREKLEAAYMFRFQLDGLAEIDAINKRDSNAYVDVELEPDYSDVVTDCIRKAITDRINEMFNKDEPNNAT